MVIHTRTIRRLLPTNCLSVLDHLMGLALKGLKFCLFFHRHVSEGTHFCVAFKNPDVNCIFLSGFSFTNLHDSQGSWGGGEAMSLNLFYYFHPFCKQLDICQSINAETLPPHIATSRTWAAGLEPAVVVPIAHH